jgi:hypothetical protein
VVVPKVYWFSKDLDRFQGDKTEAFNSLIERGLLALVPILIEYDEEDNDIILLKNEIFKGLVGFGEHTNGSKNKYLLVKPKQYQKIVWIIRPTIPVINEDYSYYLNRINRQRVTQEEIYCDVDIRTERSKKINYIKDEEFQYFLSENYEDVHNSIVESIGERRFEDLIYNNYNIETEEINVEIEKKKDLIEKEKEAIKIRNREKGERRKTSDLKKQLDKELKGLLIKEWQCRADRIKYEKLLDEIINFIPDNIFLHYKNYETKVETAE